jgi:hypothetical protein
MNIKNSISISAKAWHNVSLATVSNFLNKLDTLNRPAHHTNEEQEENESSCLIKLSYLIEKSQFDQTLDFEEYFNAEKQDEFKIQMKKCNQNFM